LIGDRIPLVGYPNIDLNNGATLKGMLDALQILGTRRGPTRKLCPGVATSLQVCHRRASWDSCRGARSRREIGPGRQDAGVYRIEADERHAL